MASTTTPTIGHGTEPVETRTPTPREKLFNVAVFVLFAVLWGAFAVALLAAPERLDDLWAEIQSLHVLLQGVVWLLFLPVMAGLWIWETDWPLALRLLLVIGLGGFNLYLFYPRRAR